MRFDSVRFAGMSVFVNLHASKYKAPSAIRKKGSTPHVVNQAFGLRILHHFRNFDFLYSLLMIQRAGNSKDLSNKKYYLFGTLFLLHSYNDTGIILVSSDRILHRNWPSEMVSIPYVATWVPR